MSEYRRFVAYIYRYQEGKKEKNTGYVKVDARNGACRMQMRIQSADVGNQKLQVYGFVRRKSWLLGIIIGEAVGKNGICEWRMNTPSERFGESKYKLSDICGMWILGEQGETYITVWDDEAVNVDRFTTELPQTPENDEEEAFAKEKKEAPLAAAGTAGSLPVAEVQAKDSGQAKDVGLGGRWQQFLYHYPGIQPFEDGKIMQCVRIAPKDISFLGRNEWSFGQNPFLQQAYVRYGHLLVGMDAGGQFILGVPGIYYDEQDRHLARMYGFPEFKKADSESCHMMLPEGEDRDRFGYWYHYINEAFS